MKKILILFSIAVSALSLSSYGQAGVYLYIPTITDGTGSGAHLNEATLSSVQDGMSISVTTSGSGSPSISPPSVSEITVTKSFDLSTLRLQNLLLTGTATAMGEIRYYNSQGVVVYSKKMETFYVTGVSQANSGEGCPSGCQLISESYSFHTTGKLTWRNLAVTPNQVLTYDFGRRGTTFTQ